MGILLITEKSEGWTGSRSEKGDYEFQRIFHVLTDDINIGPYAVMNGTDSHGNSIPLDFDDYHAGQDVLTFARVKTKAAAREPLNPMLWYVTVTYSTAKDQQDRSNPPEDRPIEISFSLQRQTKVASKTISGGSLATSAGERFNPLPEMDDSRLVMTVSRNQFDFNSVAAMDYRDSVNSDSFVGFEAGKVKLAGISAKSVFEGAIFYWRVDIEFHISDEGWDLEVLDEGTYFLNGGQKKRFKDLEGHFTTGLLDGAGGEAAVNTPSFRTFRVYKRRSFNVLVS